jgi:hypothetical protein
MRVLLHLHIANSFIYFPLILPLPTGVITAAYYTGLNINTAVLRWVNLGNARRIQEIRFGGYWQIAGLKISLIFVCSFAKLPLTTHPAHPAFLSDPTKFIKSIDLRFTSP